MSTLAVQPCPLPERKRSRSDEDEYGEEDSCDDDDDAGSLVDFVVDDPDDEADDSSVVSEGPQTKEEERARDLDGIDVQNIVTGKRIRRQTNFLAKEIFSSDEYRMTPAAKRLLGSKIPDRFREEAEEEEEEEEEEEGEEEEEEEEEESSDSD